MLSKKQNVKVLDFSGYTTEDMLYEDMLYEDMKICYEI